MTGVQSEPRGDAARADPLVPRFGEDAWANARSNADVEAENERRAIRTEERKDDMQTLVIRGEVALDAGKRGDRTWTRYAQDELGGTGLMVESAEPVAPHVGVSVLMDETDSDKPVTP